MWKAAQRSIKPTVDRITLSGCSATSAPAIIFLRRLFSRFPYLSFIRSPFVRHYPARGDRARVVGSIVQTEGERRHRSTPILDHLVIAEYTHRTANDFAAACAAVHLAKRSVDDPSTLETLLVLADRLDALSGIQRVLQPRSEPVVEFDTALSDLCSRIAEARFAQRGIFLQLRTDPITMDSRSALGVLMIVSELLVNADRHAFSNGPGLVAVDAREDDCAIICTIRDNGNGRRASRQDGHCSGSAIIAGIARDIDATIRYFDCAPGTTVEIRLRRKGLPG